jgi:hypothetical protein
MCYVAVVVLIFAIPAVLLLPRDWFTQITDRIIIRRVRRRWTDLEIVDQALGAMTWEKIIFNPATGWSVPISEPEYPPFMTMIYEHVFRLNRLRLSRPNMPAHERDTERQLWEWDLRGETARITSRLLNKYIGLDLSKVL